MGLQSSDRLDRGVLRDAVVAVMVSLGRPASATELSVLVRDVSEACSGVMEILGIGRATAYRAVHLGQIPSLRLGTRLFIPRTALVDMLSPGTGS